MVLMIVVCLVRDGVPACYFSLIENDMRVMVVGWCENAVQGKSKRKGRCGGMNATALVELTVVETATSSMRTKRSTN